jgi:hypothetical protein
VTFKKEKKRKEKKKKKKKKKKKELPNLHHEFCFNSERREKNSNKEVYKINQFGTQH